MIKRGSSRFIKRTFFIAIPLANKFFIALSIKVDLPLLRMPFITTASSYFSKDGIYEEVNDIAIKRVIAYQLEQEMKAQKVTKTKMAKMMKTSRAVVNRLLNPDNSSLTLNTLENAANVLGKKLNITIL